MVKVKICGLTRAEDAMLAADLGAAALGFVFWPGSPRFIDPFDARRLVRDLPPLVSTAGIFVDQPSEYVRGVASLVKLTAVQLHGSETLDYIAPLKVRVIKAVPLVEGCSANVADPLPRHVTVLLDAHDSVKFGGTGRQVDWTLAAAIARRRRVILSGGLRADNVGAAIEIVRPYAVDVSSGVEQKPGIKDWAKLRAFFEAVQRVAPEVTRA
jgi:phosphoribosylanthranilate isomerase